MGAYILKGWGNEISQGKVKDPVSSSAETHSLGTPLKWEDFGAVDPCCGSLQKFGLANRQSGSVFFS